MEIINQDDQLLSSAVDKLAALAQEQRLSIFRLLVQAGPNGLAAGDIAKALNTPPSTLSFHLSHLKNSGLIQDERKSRSIIYRPVFSAISSLASYLLENCCQGQCAANTTSQKETSYEPISC